MNDPKPQRENPDSLMLFGFWYRALPAEDLSNNQLRKAMLLEVPLVLGRDKRGRPFAMQDVVPIAACRFLMAGLTASNWNAVIMGGHSTPTPANASSFHRSPQINR